MSKLYSKLESYDKQEYCPMHMPGHKRNIELLGNKLPYNIDITEIDGFDDLHHATGVIKEIENKAEKIFGSERSFILVNGSTCGILAGIRAVVKPYDKILVARNCHKSVYHAIEMNFLEPTYIVPEVNEEGIDIGISVEKVKELLEKDREIKLIVVTSPSYEGIISNIREISEIAHSYGIPILVDEAHGAHLNFMTELKRYEALNCGADIVIQSLHKTLPALTQTAIMHVKSDLVDEKKIERQLQIFETSSPSYILMSSVDECLKILDENYNELFEIYNNNLTEFYEEMKKLKKIKILGNNIKENQVYDKGKIVIITSNTNITGKQLADILRKDYKIETEMANINYVIAMTSICDKKENFNRLADALMEIDEKLIYKENKEINYVIQLPKRKTLINEALNNEQYSYMNYKEAKGMVSKEYMWIYPPGIPMIVPGEVITDETIKKVDEIIKSNIEIRTTYDEFPNICVINLK